MPYESAPTLQTKEAIAYERLKMLILSGEIQKNEFLSQRALARHVDTNLTTLRTALRQLERDGLIENVPKWGVRVPLETEERLLDLYFMRELLETGAVRRIVKRRKEVDFATLAKKAEECDARARKLPKNIIEYSQSHFDFHMELARQSGSELLARSLRGIHFRSWLLWHDLRLWQQRDRSGHQRLVDVLAHSREAEAVAEIRKHINVGLQDELVALGEAQKGSHLPPMQSRTVSSRPQLDSSARTAATALSTKP